MALVIQPPKPPEEIEKPRFFRSILGKQTISKPEIKLPEQDFLEQEDLLKKGEILKLKETTYQREVEQLGNLRKNVDEEIKQRRDNIKQMEEQLEKKQTILWEKEKTLEQKEKLLQRRQQADVSALQLEIAELRQKKGLETKAGDASNVRKVLAEKDKLLQRKESSLRKFEEQINSRASQVIEQEAALSREYNELSKKTESHETNIQNLELQKDAVNQDIQRHLERLNADHLSVKQREREIDEVQKDLGEKEQDLQKQEALLKDLKAVLTAKDRELSKKEYLLSHGEKSIRRQEEDRKKVSAEFANRQKEMQEHTEILSQKKQIFEQEFPLSLEKLSKIREEWQIKEGLLREKSSQVLGDKAEVEGMLEKIEADVKLLETKEGEIADKVDELERDKSLLENEEIRILDRVRKLEEVEGRNKERERNIAELEEQLRKEEQSIREEADRIEGAKLMKKELPGIKRVYTKLKKQIQWIDDEALAKRELLKNEEEKLRQKEREMEYKEAELQYREKQLIQEEYELTQAQRQAGAAISAPQATQPYNYIYALVSKARDCIASHSLEEASRVIGRIESAIQNIEEGERKQFVYDIMELKTDVKLANLT
jgi:DNA repair exonuclease SbcCD ATPase subunit